MRVLVTGGVRSGKSRYALDLARQTEVPGPKCFLATAEPLDHEMKIRITRHQQERTGDFVTLEEPVHLARRVETAGKDSGLILVDCMTVWVGNLLHYFDGKPEQIGHEIETFLNSVREAKAGMIFVTNEVGLGVMPENALSRRYIDQLGILNQSLARMCDEVIFMVSGIPTKVKGEFNARLVD